MESTHFIINKFSLFTFGSQLTSRTTGSSFSNILETKVFKFNFLNFHISETRLHILLKLL